MEDTVAESSVYAVMIWLRPTDAAAQSDDPQLSLQEGHRSFVFNPPALSHIRYAHFSRREEALESLKFLGQGTTGGSHPVRARGAVVLRGPRPERAVRRACQESGAGRQPG